MAHTVAKEKGGSGMEALLTVGHISPSMIRNLDLVDDRGSAGEGESSAILF